MPVPPELQATAEALQPRHHRPNPRNRSHSTNNDNSANASSGSGEVSQRSSRPHSVRTSASHSRVSSRTGSVHTSPRFNPANRSLYDTPEVPPPVPYPEALHNSRYLHPNPPVENTMNNPYAYSYSPIEGSPTSVFKWSCPCPSGHSHHIPIYRFTIATLLLRTSWLRKPPTPSLATKHDRASAFPPRFPLPPTATWFGTCISPSLPTCTTPSVRLNDKFHPLAAHAGFRRKPHSAADDADTTGSTGAICSGQRLS